MKDTAVSCRGEDLARVKG